jgi:hypothetical protein
MTASIDPTALERCPSADTVALTGRAFRLR